MPVQVVDGFDNSWQANRIADMIMPGETLYLVFDCKGRGSGFIGVTSHRIIVRDDGHRRKDLTSIAYSKIHSIGVDAQKGLIRGGSSSLSFAAGDDDWAVQFKGPDKARRAYQRIMAHWLGLEATVSDAEQTAAG